MLSSVFVEEICYQEENYIVIDFYYGKMMYQTSEEELTYGFFNMIGTLDVKHCPAFVYLLFATSTHRPD